MNFLAHSYLSFTDDQIIGNLIGDFIKNRDKKNLREGIQQGVMLHRAIDAFTDVHPKVSEAKTVFQPLVRLYSGAFVDVVFDYFLANDAEIKTSDEWMRHTEHVYEVLYRSENELPENFRLMLLKMKADNWLYNYRYDWGIDYSIRNVLHKAKFLTADTPVFELFLQNKPFLKTCFDDFFPDLHEFCIKMNETFP